MLELAYGHWFDKASLQSLNILTSANLTYNVEALYKSSKTRTKYSRDQHGFRGEYDDISDIDILTIGGSTTDQRYIDDSETWQSILMKKCNESNNKRFSIVNAGVDGQSTVGHLVTMDMWLDYIPDLRARYLLMYVGVNDLFTDGGHYDDILGENTVKGAIKGKSALYRVYTVARGSFLAKHVFRLGHQSVDFSEIEWTSKPLRNDHEVLMKSVLHLYSMRLRELIQRAVKLGAKPIFVTQTMSSYKVVNNEIYGSDDFMRFHNRAINGVDLYYLMKLMNQQTMAVCREVNGICIDLASELNLDDADFYDTVHNTPQGARKIGRYLYTKLSPHLEVSS